MKYFFYSAVILVALLFSPVVEAMEGDPDLSQRATAKRACPSSDRSNLVTRDTVEHIRKWAGLPEDWKVKSADQLTQYFKNDPVEEGSFVYMARQGFKTYCVFRNLIFMRQALSPKEKIVESLRKKCAKWASSGQKLEEDNPLKPLADQAYNVIMFEDDATAEAYLKKVLSALEETL